MRIWRIYKITNTVNGKVYVGQTRNSVAHRFKSHCHPKSPCTKLRHALTKYGSDSFSFEEIAGCRTRADADETERQVIAAYNSVRAGYNIAPGGGGHQKDFCKRGHKIVGPDCKECRRIRRRERYLIRNEHFKEKARRWRALNPDKVVAISKATYQKHRNERLAYQRNRRQEQRAVAV